MLYSCTHMATVGFKWLICVILYVYVVCPVFEHTGVGVVSLAVKFQASKVGCIGG